MRESVEQACSSKAWCAASECHWAICRCCVASASSNAHMKTSESTNALTVYHVEGLNAHYPRSLRATGATSTDSAFSVVLERYITFGFVIRTMLLTK